VIDDNQEVVVCASCLQSSCWQGFFYCDNARYSDIKIMTVGELKKLNLEHPDYWYILPELTPEEKEAMNKIPADFIDRIFRGERPITDPTTFAN
jgi:hypothetical protein